MTTTSVVALLAGATVPARAQTFVINSNAGNVTITGTFTAVTVGTGVSVGGSVINNGSVTAPGGDAVTLKQGSFVGGITNNSVINATRGPDGIFISENATVVGGLSNAAGGTISSGGVGIQLADSVAGAFSTFQGGITNAGKITASGAGIVFGTTLSGGNLTTFLGGIANTGTIIGNGGGVLINFGSIFSGGISNSGTISASGTGSARTGIGISVYQNSTFSGGITNSGMLSSVTRTGILVDGVETFIGNIANSGTIVGGSRAGGSGAGIIVSGLLSFAGGITNTGTLSSADRNGILVLDTGIFGGTVSGIAVGGITNAGTISVNTVGIQVGTSSGVVSTFSGGIVNTSNITAGSSGIAVQNVGTFLGGISNAGVISAGGAGILVGTSAFGVGTFGGGITNTGTISAGGTGISLGSTPSVSIFDTGTITGGNGTAIQFASGTNTLTLGPGFVINGNVLGVGADIFQLGGAGTGAFNLSTLGTQYTGFTTYNVISATWVATGTGAQNWTISSGATLQLGNDGTSGAITGNVADNGVFAIDRSDTYTFGGTISGTGSFIQEGSGTSVLSGTNGYSGGTTITAGALQVTNDSSVGTGTVTLNGGTFQAGAAGLVITNPFVIGTGNGTIDTQANTLNLSGTISNASAATGSLTKTGGGTLTVSGTNSYSGTTTVNAGTFQAGAANVFAPSSAFTVATGAVLNLNNFNETIGSLTGGGGVTLGSGTLTTGNDGTSTNFAGTINGTGSLAKIGTGTFTLSGTNSYTGATSVNAGSLQAGAVNAFASSSAFTVGSGAILNLNNFNQTIGSLTGGGSVTLGSGTLTTGNDGTSTNFAGTISGSGSLMKIGTGTFTLSGADSYTGTTTVSAGGLQAGAANVFAPSSAFTVATGAVLNLNNFNQTIGSLAGGGNVTLGSGTLTTGNDNSSTNFTGTIGGTGSLVKIGSGTLTLSGANGYSGGTTLSAGTLGVGNSTALGTGGLTMAAGTTLQAAATGLTLANAVTLSGVATIDSQANVFALSGAISGPGSLVKIGTGTLTLSGANGYSGGTTLSAGTLGVGNNTALGTGGLTMADGTTLQAAATGLTLANTVTLSGADTIDSQGNNLTLSGNMGGTGSLTKIGTGMLTLSGTDSYTGGTTILGGTLIGTTASLQGNIVDNAALIFQQATAGSYSGALSGNGTLAIQGSGMVTLTGNNSGFTGNTMLTAGTLDVSNNGALGSGGLTMANGTTLQAAANGLTLPNAVTLTGADTIDSQANVFTISGNISGTGSLVKIGTGMLTLSGANSYSGGTTLSAGTLGIGNNGALGTGGLAMVNGTTLQAEASGLVLGNTVTLGGADTIDTQANGLTLSGTIGGTGSLVKIGTGTLTLSGANGYSGGTTLSAGILAVGNSNALGTGTLTLAGSTTLQAAASGLTLANAVALGGADTIDSQGNVFTLSGNITGSGSLTKISSGTLTLSGANSYGGGTTLSAGTLGVGNSNALGTGGLAMAGGTTLQAAATGLVLGNTVTLGGADTFDSQGNVFALSGNITGSGSLVKIGMGTLTLSGANNYSGATTVNAGNLQAGAANAFVSSSAFTIAGGAVLDLNNFSETIGSLAGAGSVTLGSGTLATGNNGTSTSFTGTIAGTGSLVKIGAGTLTLSGTDSYTGTTTISGGSLQAGAANVFAPSSAFTVAGGAVLDINNFSETIGSLAGAGNVTLGSGTLTTGNDGTSTSFAGTIGGTGSLVKIGTGTLTLTGANSYTGTTAISAGSLQAGADNVFAPSSAFTLANGAVLNLNNFNETIASLAGGGSVTLGSGTLTTGNDGTSTSFTGTIAGTGSLVKIGAGTLTLSGTDSYTGTTTLSAGSLQAGAGSAFAPSSAVAIAGGAVLDLNGFNETIGSLTGSGSVTLGAGTLTTGNDNTSTTFTGTISGTGSLAKIGTGTLTLSGADSYTGTTAISAGALQAGAANVFAPTSAFAIATGAILDLNSFNETIGSLAGSGGVTLGSGTLTTGSDGTSTTFAGTIGGVGSLVKIGTGTLTLSGTSGYTGTTTVAAGTFRAGAANAFAPSSAFAVANGAVLNLNSFAETIGSLAGAGSVALGAGMLTTGNDNTSTTFSGTIDGSGLLVKIGTGTQTLSGADTYSGGTTLSGGTITVGNNTALGTGGLSMAAGTTLGFLASGNFTLGNNIALSGDPNFAPPAGTTQTLTGVISDGNSPGTLAMLGPGTLVLTGTNTYSGGTTLSAGTLGVGNSSALGTGGLAMAGGTTLQAAANGLTLANAVTLGGAGTVDSQANNLTLSGTIGGTGSLTKIGTGTLILPGANTYSGGTSLAAGTLGIGNSSALGTGGLTIAGGTTLQALASGLTLANAVTLGGASTVDTQGNVVGLSGNIGGTGSLVVIGNGFVTLSGTNSYTGGTSILNGTLIGTTGSLQGNILDNAALIFEQPTAGTYGGSLSGNGTLTIHGAGTVTFTGNDSSFTGETRLAAGSLEVGTLATPGATLGGTVDVLSGGVLSGHGTVSTVNNIGGTVMPGGTIGTLTVTGNYTQASTGTLAIEVSPSASSQLKVGGAASLGGTLALTYDPGTYKPTTYTFLTAPTISGSFNNVTTSGSPGLSQGLSINLSTGQLVLGGAVAVVAPINDTVFPAMTSTLVQNAQQANSIVLDRLLSRLGITGETPGFAGITASPGSQLAQLGGGNLGPIQGIATAMPDLTTEGGGWFRGIGSFGSVNGNSTAPGFSVQSGGFLAGFDREVSPDIFAGIAAGYTHSNVGEHSTSNGDVSTARLMGYGGGLVGSSIWSATVGYAHDTVDTSRGLAGIGTAQESHGANEVTLGAQWSLPLQVAGTTIVPKVGARFLELLEDSFVENGAAGNNLTGQSNSTTSFQPFVGVIASRNLTTDSGMQLTPTVQFGYAHELADDNRIFNVNSTDGTAFLVQGVRPSRDMLTAGAGLTMRAQDNLYLFADYNATLPTGNTVNQTFSVGLRVLFPPTSEPASEPPLDLGSVSPAERPELLAQQQELFNQTFRDPGNLDVIFDYAKVSARVGDNEAAAEALERLLLFNPNLPSVEIELGVLYYRMGSFKAAQAYLDTARTLNPSPAEQARIEEYTAKIAAAQQTNGFAGTFEIGTQYQTDANVAPGSPLIHSPIGDVLLNNQFVKHDDTNFFAATTLLYNYDLGTQDGDAIEVMGTGFGNHYLQFSRLDLDFGEVSAGPRIHFPELNLGPVQSATLKPYAILNEVGLGEHQYFWTYGAGLEGTARLWDDLSAKIAYEFREKSFTNAPDRPLSTGLSGNDNLVRLELSKPVTANSMIVGEFDYLDQSTRFSYYTNNTYAAAASYHITYADPVKFLNRPWETVFFGSRSWSIYAAPDPCCNTSGSATTFSSSARDDRHWRFGLAQSFELTASTALTFQLQRDIVSSNLPIYGYSSDSFLADLKVRF